jgi:hypothetical protein
MIGWLSAGTARECLLWIACLSGRWGALQDLVTCWSRSRRIAPRHLVQWLQPLVPAVLGQQNPLPLATGGTTWPASPSTAASLVGLWPTTSARPPSGSPSTTCRSVEPSRNEDSWQQRWKLTAAKRLLLGSARSAAAPARPGRAAPLVTPAGSGRRAQVCPDCRHRSPYVPPGRAICLRDVEHGGVGYADETVGAGGCERDAVPSVAYACRVEWGDRLPGEVTRKPGGPAGAAGQGADRGPVHPRRGAGGEQDLPPRR